MERTPGPVLYLIIGLCGVESTMLLECMSVCIKDKLRSNLSAFQYQAQKRYRSDRKSFSDTKEFLKSLHNQESEDLQFLPYYTDGAVQSHGSCYFMINMAIKKYKHPMQWGSAPIYCTHRSRGTNVIVKSIFSGQTIKNFEPDIHERYRAASDYRIAGENEYMCQHILDEFSPVQQLCVVNSMSIAFPSNIATCPVQYLLVFLGIEEGAENLELPYFDLKSLQDVKLKSMEQKIPIKATGSNEILEYAIFSQLGDSMQPALWIGYKDQAYEEDDEDLFGDQDHRKIKVDFPNIFIANQMRVLLIDANRRSDTNVDVDYVIPGGFLLK